MTYLTVFRNQFQSTVMYLAVSKLHSEVRSLALEYCKSSHIQRVCSPTLNILLVYAVYVVEYVYGMFFYLHPQVLQKLRAD